jgi:hypothetical protein
VLQIRLISVIGGLLLSGCGGSQPPTDATEAANHTGPTQNRRVGHGQKTFLFTGHEQTFVVPRNITIIEVDVVGASGASDIRGHGHYSHGGRGGRVTAALAAVARERFAIYVGGDGTGQSGGYNGGGDGGLIDNPNGFGGGGASDVRGNIGEPEDRIVVAGGGGGAGADGNYYPPGFSEGGQGGGLFAGSGGSGFTEFNESGHGGGGGYQTAGGLGGFAGGNCRPRFEGRAGESGAFSIGGYAQPGGAFGKNVGGGDGGGGGGYFGGGGGGSGCGGHPYRMSGGGGGGGSSYADPSATHVRMWKGWGKQRAGFVTITW